MFAVAIHDTKEKKVILARDRMGEKPLYVYQDASYYIFGSEIKSLMSTGLIEKRIHKRALNQYLQLTYIPAPLSIFEGVYKVKPGHVLTIGLDGVVEDTCYWNFPTEKVTEEAFSYEEAKKELNRLLTESVKDRMVSDVPLGAFLSGGIFPFNSNNDLDSIKISLYYILVFKRFFLLIFI